MSPLAAVPAQEEKMRRYYRLHAAFYDATRWTFLLGRIHLLRNLPLLSKKTRTGTTFLTSV
jgi:hypothetical protein